MRIKELSGEDRYHNKTKFSMDISNTGDYCVTLQQTRGALYFRDPDDFFRPIKEIRGEETIIIDFLVDMSGDSISPAVKSAFMNLYNALQKDSRVECKSCPDIKHR